ncbi:MAG: hypothetical protein WBP45_14975 [Daejeonella sp.]
MSPAKMLLENPIYDPLGIEIFAIDETFESVFNGLAGVYFRLYFKEYKKGGDPKLIAKFHKRFLEIKGIKSSYPYNAWEQKKTAVELYGEELKAMVSLELEYAGKWGEWKYAGK